MRTHEGESYVRLTASCEIAVSNIGDEGGCVVMGIAQRIPEGTGVTTLLLCADRARELAAVLLRHSCDNESERGVE